MGNGMHGGVHIPSLRRAGRNRIANFAPARVMIPLTVSGGDRAQPLVTPGETVLLGQVIARTADGFQVHASVSGVVERVESRLLADGAQGVCVEIANDGKNSPDPTLRPSARRLGEMTPEELAIRIREGGIAGLSDKTELWRRLSERDIKAVVIRGMETEPKMAAVRRLLTEKYKEIAGGCRILMRALGAERAILAVSKNADPALPYLKKLTARVPFLSVEVMSNKYPAGHPVLLKKAIAGRYYSLREENLWTVSTETCLAVYRLFVGGEPLIRRVVTVGGSCVGKPRVFSTPVGTPVSDLLSAAGQTKEPKVVLLSGPLTGKAAAGVDVPLDTDTRAILAFRRTTAEMLPRRLTPTCIRCGRCEDVCPVRLKPRLLMELRRTAETEAQFAKCIGCGLCTYICPGKTDVLSQLTAHFADDAREVKP